MNNNHATAREYVTLNGAPFSVLEAVQRYVPAGPLTEHEYKVLLYLDEQCETTLSIPADTPIYAGGNVIEFEYELPDHEGREWKLTVSIILQDYNEDTHIMVWAECTDLDVFLESQQCELKLEEEVTSLDNIVPTLQRMLDGARRRLSRVQ